MNREEQLTMAIMDLLNKRGWLDKAEMENRLTGYKASEVHCIESIGKLADPNVTKLAESLYMTRGAISKLTKKLSQKGLIESYQKSDNKKEIYFRLTAQGQAVFQIHEEVHQEFQKRDQVVYDQLTNGQVEMMFSFIKIYNQHLDEEIKKQGLKV